MSIPTLPTSPNAVQSMNSLQIAELVQSRHDSVKRTIERLADQEAIQLPPLVDTNKNGIVTKVYIFSGEQGKLDSITVVAQLCPLFTARMVKRWQELETQVAQGALTADPLHQINANLQKMTDGMTVLANGMQVLAQASAVQQRTLDRTEDYIKLLELNQKGSVKVTPEVIEQVKLMKQGGYSQANIGRMLRLSGATVSLIINDKYPMNAITHDNNIARLVDTAKTVLAQKEQKGAMS